MSDQTQPHPRRVLAALPCAHLDDAFESASFEMYQPGALHIAVQVPESAAALDGAS